MKPCVFHCYCRFGFHPSESDQLDRYQECCKCTHRRTIPPKDQRQGSALEPPDDDAIAMEEKMKRAEDEGRDLKDHDLL